MRKFFLSPLSYAVFAVAALACYLYWTSQQAVNNGGRYARQTAVVSYTVSEQIVTEKIEALATAQANESVSLSVKNSGLVDTILFDDGDKVQAGQTILTIDAREQRARLKALNIRLAEAQRQLTRLENLAKQSATSEQQVDEQRGIVNVLNADIEVVESQLDYHVVKAPFSGILGYRNISVGALLRPGDAITTLDDIDILKIDFSIAEKYFAAVQSEQTIQASASAAPNQVFSGVVTSIDSRVDPITRSFLVRAQIDNSQRSLRPGMLLNVELQRASRAAMVVPESALIPVGEQQYVYVIDPENSTVSKQAIVLGERRPGWVEVVEGLYLGQKIVIEGAMKLRDGSKVVLSQDSSNSQGA